jgi:uncharacterized protein YqhQ
MTEDRIITYGGQAVIEGVLMRGQKGCAIAMRAPDGEIKVHTEKLSGIYKSKVTKIPFLRGSVLLWDALGLGMRALTIAANIQTGEDEKLEGPALYTVMAVSLTFSIALFFLLPFGGGKLAQWLALGMPAAGNVASAAQTAFRFTPDIWVAAITEGVIRLLLIIGYMWAIGKMPDVNRLFRYHGAEHKTINAFEAGAELTPESVAKFPLEHPRCGTSFLLTLIIFSIIAFVFLYPLPVPFQIIGRIVLIPVLAGVALEYIRWIANHLDSPIVQWLIKPNLALQHLTTREPDLSMLEVSIRSFNEMRALEQEITL